MSFANRVYALCKRIPKGKVTTYGDIARALGISSPRAVGQALRCNPSAPLVPCHRVISSNGTIGGFRGKREGKVVTEKIALLRQEGISIVDNKIDLKKYQHRL